MKTQKLMASFYMNGKLKKQTKLSSNQAMIIKPIKYSEGFTFKSIKEETT